jgi:thiamine biosynthesis lipoprotein
VRYDKRLCLDLGGIAKGFAVDRAIDALEQYRISSAVVNAGGDMRVLGQHPEAVYIRDPHDPKTMIHAGELSDGAIATSGIYFSKDLSIDHNASALVDPWQHQSVMATNSFSVLASTCMLADGLTKVLAVGRNPTATYFTEFKAQAIIL